MDEYWCKESVAEQLFMFETDADKEKFLDKVQTQNLRIEGNLDRVSATIDSLIDKLSKLDDLAEHLDNYGQDVLGQDFYFSDFNTDKGQGYIGNNFGQDLRNFKRFLEYARSKGTKTVYFNYG